MKSGMTGPHYPALPQVLDAPTIEAGACTATGEAAARIPPPVLELAEFGIVRFAVVYALLLASAIWLLGGIVNVWAWHGSALVNARGANVGRDFVEFWSAGRMALAGHSASAYDHGLLHAAESRTTGAPTAFTPWFYPPIAFLLAAPLALLPYLVALVIWLVAPLAAWWRTLRPFAAHPLTWLAALIFPATAQSLICGQNGVLSACIVTAGLAKLDTRPVLSGLVLSTLCYKPHMALAVFAALVFGRHWRAAGAVAIAGAALVLTSVALFGFAPWEHFLSESRYARELLETGQAPLSRMSTVFAAARVAGQTLGVAYFLQLSVACAAFGGLFLVWRRRDVSTRLRVAVLAAVLPLTTPYAFDYDLVVVFLSLAFLLGEGLVSGFRPGELFVMAAAWAIPVGGWLLVPLLHIQVTPIVLILLLVVLLDRAFGWRDKGAALPEGRGVAIATAGN